MKELKVEMQDLPCCGLVETHRLRELPHVYGFDFDLFQCSRCGRYWVYAWKTVGVWEEASATDAQKMLALEYSELRDFMKEWARSFE